MSADRPDQVDDGADDDQHHCDDEQRFDHDVNDSQQPGAATMPVTPGPQTRKRGDEGLGDDRVDLDARRVIASMLTGSQMVLVCYNDAHAKKVQARIRELIGTVD